MDGFLVLSRKKDETVILDGLGEVSVIEIRPNRVVLGFKFPREVQIARSELSNDKQSDNKDTSKELPVPLENCTGN